VADAAADTPVLLARLQAAGLAPVEARPIVPSLEDVFLHAIEGAERGAGQA